MVALSQDPSRKSCGGHFAHKPRAILVTILASTALQSGIAVPDCQQGTSIVKTIIELDGVSRPSTELETRLSEDLVFTSGAARGTRTLRLYMFGSGLHLDVLSCDREASPVASYRMAVAAHKLLGNSTMRWSATTDKPLENADMQLYFDMMVNLSQDKVLLASHTSSFSTTDIWRIGSATRLMLNNVIMSDSSDEYKYHEMLAHPALIAVELPRNVLIIGGGEGAALREVLRDTRVENATMVDLDAGLMKVCKEHLAVMHQGSFDSARATVISDDGAAFLQRAPPGTFDVIIVDGIDFGDSDDIDAFGTASYGNILFEEQFFRDVYSALRPGGTFAQYLSNVDRGDIRDALFKTGFSDTVQYCIDVQSFFGAGACFGLSIKAASEPLEALLHRRAVEASSRETGWTYFGPQTLVESLKDTNKRRLKGAGYGVANDVACFPASAKILMSDSTWRAITELAPGSTLASPDLDAAFSGEQLTKAEFMGDMHSHYPGHEDVILDFVEIAHAQMSESQPLHITANHLLPVRRGDHPWMLLPASQVRVGDHLFAEDPESRKLVPSAITATRQVTDKGMFAPLTTSGRLLVNGVSVSSYALTHPSQQALWETSPWFRKHVSDLWAVLVFPSRVLHLLGVPYMWMHEPIVHSLLNRLLNMFLRGVSFADIAMNI